MTEFRGPIHIGLDLASDILERCGEEKAKEIVDAIANALPGWMSVEPVNQRSARSESFGRFEPVKKYSFLTRALRPDCSARAVRPGRPARTFAGRAVFSQPHMSPEKMIGFSFAAPLVKGCEVFGKWTRLKRKLRALCAARATLCRKLQRVGIVQGAQPLCNDS